MTAIWTLTKYDSQPKGKLQIIDHAAYIAMRDLHDRVCEGMNKPALKWENTVEKKLIK